MRAESLSSASSKMCRLCNGNISFRNYLPRPLLIKLIQYTRLNVLPLFDKLVSCINRKVYHKSSNRKESVCIKHARFVFISWHPVSKFALATLIVANCLNSENPNRNSL